MDDLRRRRMLVGMGLAEPIPPLAVRRSWEFIDDRVPPEGEADGQFDSHVVWVNKAASWIGWTGARTYDAKDRRCRNGGDMQRARDEDAFPVRWYLPHRFAHPVVPTVRETRVRNIVASAGATGILQEEMRKRVGMRSVTPRQIADALRDRATLVDGRWTMTPEGMEQLRFESEQARRASYVR